MALMTFSMIFLGNSADLDPVEGNNGAENAASLVGTYYSAGDPAYQYITTVTADDANNDAIIQGDGFGAGEAYTYDVGAGTVTTALDFAATVNVTISFTASSGEPDYVSFGGIVQTAEGDLFLVMIDDDFGLGANALDDQPIDSIAVTSIVSSGQNQNAAASDDQEFVTCFVRGTKVLTNFGPTAVETLQIGDLVQTAENGLQPIRYITKSSVPARQLQRNPKLRPVRISAGTLGRGVPSRDLLVSRQHRMLASSPIARRMFGCSEVFISAIKLTALPGIFVDHGKALSQIDYFHILLDKHEVIFAESAPTESLYPGSFALDALPDETKVELKAITPKLSVLGSSAQTGFPNPSNKKQNEFVARCSKNRKPVLVTP